MHEQKEATLHCLPVLVQQVAPHSLHGGLDEQRLSETTTKTVAIGILTCSIYYYFIYNALRRMTSRQQASPCSNDSPIDRLRHPTA